VADHSLVAENKMLQKRLHAEEAKARQDLR
jgi:hypothetical protein